MACMRKAYGKAFVTSPRKVIDFVTWTGQGLPEKSTGEYLHSSATQELPQGLFWPENVNLRVNADVSASLVV